MNRYEAFYAAADQIERHPETLDSNSCRFPGCGTPGSALGWVAYFGGLEKTRVGSWSVIDMTKFMTLFPRAFYVWMGEVVSSEWRIDPTACAKGLRLFADTYFADEAPASDDVQALLDRASRRAKESGDE